MKVKKAEKISKLAVQKANTLECRKDEDVQKHILIYGMTDNAGGMESYVMNYFRYIDRSILMFDFVTDCPRIAYQDEIECLGGKVFFIPNKRHLLSALYEFYKLLKLHQEYEMIYFNILSAPKSIFMLPAILNRRIRIVHSHNADTAHRLLQALTRPFLNHFANIKFACSVKAAKFMFGAKAVERGEVTVINNAIELDKYTYNPVLRDKIRTDHKLQDAFVIGTVGRFSDQKNPYFLIDIFKALLNICPQAVLLWVGTGEWEQQVKQKIYALGLNENVIFMGMRSDVPELMQAFDIFLLPSKFEGLPVVGIEAQAAGLPCFFSDVITREVALTVAVEFIKLKEPAKYWADRILLYQKFKRVNTDYDIKQVGYDIVDCSAVLVKILLEL